MTEAESYTFGLVAAEGSHRGNVYTVDMHSRELPVLKKTWCALGGYLRPVPKRHVMRLSLYNLRADLKRVAPADADLHYARGLLDGDGCINFASGDNVSYSYGRRYFYATLYWREGEEFIRDFYVEFVRSLGLTPKERRHRGVTHGVFLSSPDSETLVRAVYTGAEFVSPFKLQRASEVLHCDS